MSTSYEGEEEMIQEEMNQELRIKNRKIMIALIVTLAP